MSDKEVFLACTSSSGRSKTKLAWAGLICYTLEKSCAWTAFWWGVWVLICQPLAANIPMMRGMYLMNEVFSWTHIRSDWIWGLGTALPAFVQLYFIERDKRPGLRAHLSLHLAAVFIFISILLTAANWRNTGLIMYGSLAFSELACYAQLVQRRKWNE